jgi:hypothetical protein
MSRWPLLMLFASASWCFDARCDYGVPALVEHSYLRPSFVICPLKPGGEYVCQYVTARAKELWR